MAALNAHLAPGQQQQQQQTLSVGNRRPMLQHCVPHTHSCSILIAMSKPSLGDIAVCSQACCCIACCHQCFSG